MVLQRVSQGQRGHGLHEAGGNPMAAHLSQVLYCVRVTVAVNESGQKNVVLAIDVLGVLGVGANDGAVYDHRAGGKDALPVEDADVVERDFARSC